MAKSNGYCNIDDCPLYYEITGNGDVIVFLHGNGGSGKEFEKNINDFKTDYCCITIDMRLQGRSSKKTKKELTYKLFADDVIKVLDNLNIEKFSVIGFSDGAITALYLAQKNEDRLKKMILIGANYNVTGLKRMYVIIMKSLRLFYRMLCFIPFFKRQYKLFSLMTKYPNFTVQDLKKINIPALVMAGQYDMIKDEHTRTLAKCLDAKLEIIENQGHFWHAQKSIVLKEKVYKFLRA